MAVSQSVHLCLVAAQINDAYEDLADGILLSNLFAAQPLHSYFWALLGGVGSNLISVGSLIYRKLSYFGVLGSLGRFPAINLLKSTYYCLRYNILPTSSQTERATCEDMKPKIAHPSPLKPPSGPPVP
jgi:hypothetical protein